METQTRRPSTSLVGLFKTNPHAIIFLLCGVLILIILGCVSTPPPNSRAQENQPLKEKMKVAILGFYVIANTYGVGNAGQKVADMLTSSLYKTGSFSVVERKSIDSIMNEQQFQLSGAVDPTTAVQLGRILDAQLLIRGTISEITFTPLVMGIILVVCSADINAHVIDARTGMTVLPSFKKTGRSYAGGVLAIITADGKTRDDLLGIKRTSEDMINSALRDAAGKIADSIASVISEKETREAKAEVSSPQTVRPATTPEAFRSTLFKPIKPTKLIVPFAPGGSSDLLAKIIISLAPKYFDNSFSIVTKAGGGGEVGIASVAKSKPDGYTFYVGPFRNPLNPLYDPFQYLIPISQLSIQTNGVLNGLAAPKGTPPDVIDYFAERFKNLTDDPEFINRLREISQNVEYLGPKECAKYLGNK